MQVFLPRKSLTFRVIFHPLILLIYCVLERTKNLPEINTWNTLVEVGLINASDTASREEDSDERRVIAAWPVFDREDKRICVMLWRIGELEEAVQ